MVKLSNRLQKIADFIAWGESVADIGTDHGFLPISLWETGKSPHVILSDINSGPLEKSRANIGKYLPEKNFDIRIGNGIRTIKPAEVDAVVIAGMGGLLISEIMGDDLEKSRSYRKFVLQPRNAQDKLRGWLFDNGFEIRDEMLVREGRYICEIIMAVPGNFMAPKDPEDLELEISPALFKRNDPLLVEFIENKIRIEYRVHAAIGSGAAKDREELLYKSEKRIETLQKLRKRCD